jgi:protoheme IX farnesyltransferase
MIIFMWTPPHFWALALFVKTDYAKVGIPMMPVVAGEKSTRRQIFAYSVLLLPLTLLPVFLPKADGGPGWIYGVSAGVLSTLFLLLAIRVGFRERSDDDDRMKPEKQLFAYSVLYLFALFAALVADRWVPIIGGYL